jgi:hypothetical protein
MKKNRILTLCALAVITAGICIFTSIHTYAIVPPDTGEDCLVWGEWQERGRVDVCQEGGCLPMDNMSTPLKGGLYAPCK